MNQNEFLSYYSIECFRDQADREYILARMAYRAKFFNQYQWSALHSIEKYIKAILLFNRISSITMGHNLLKGINLLKNLPFISLRENTINMINHFNNFGCNRYLTNSYISSKESHLKN